MFPILKSFQKESKRKEWVSPLKSVLENRKKIKRYFKRQIVLESDKNFNGQKIL